MFSWGENCQQGFRVKKVLNLSAGKRVHFLNLSFNISDLSVSYNVLVFRKSNGDASIICTKENDDGTRARMKQKFVKDNIRAVSCGDDLVALLSNDGTVYCLDIADPLTHRTPDVLCDISVSQVACGSHHAIALMKDGQVYTWGQDSRGQLGLGKGKSGNNSPQQLRCLSSIPVVQVAAGGDQSFALSISGSVFSWGSNNRGQLGLGDTIDRHTPTLVHYLNMKKIIQISCGQSHTATLTKDGAVLTFGSSQYGQLGHNSFRDELHPRFVGELWGAKVIKIACGRNHTLVLTDSKRVYSFGCGQQGQLGHSEKSHCSVPLPVELPQAKIRSIYAGGNSSFATVWFNEEATETHSKTKKMKVHKTSRTEVMHNVVQPHLEDMIDRWTSAHDSKSLKKTKEEIRGMFSSASCVNQSFLNQRDDKHYQTSEKYCGLNMALAESGFMKLAQNMDVLAEVTGAIIQLLPSLDKKPLGVEGLRIYILLNELLHATSNYHCYQHVLIIRLIIAIALSLKRLSPDSLQVTVDWWCSLPNPTRVNHIQAWKRAIAIVMSQGGSLKQISVLLLFLEQLYNANNNTAESTRIPSKTFCMEINEYFIQMDLQHGREAQKNKPLILGRFPFIMDLKSKLIGFNLSVTMNQQTISSRFLSDPYFRLNLQRGLLLEETFRKLRAASHSDYKKPLMVHFDNDTTVTLVYRKDFFHHFFHQLFSTKPEMFLFNDFKTLTWFPTKLTKKQTKKFFLIGVVCGMALCNMCTIRLPFPLALFKKLLNKAPSLEDLCEFSPGVAQSLQAILDYEDSTLKELGMDFVIDWNGAEVHLDPKNPEKAVTGQNKKEFVDAYVNHVFNTSVARVFETFKQGFFTVCDPGFLTLFQPIELKQMLVSEEVCDWAKLEQNACYENGYHSGHPTIRMFWEVFNELSEDQRKDFLWFLTGFRGVPVLGFSQFFMRVGQKFPVHLNHNQHFPEALTCHSLLYLPSYSTKKIMRQKLTEAIIPEKLFSM